MRSRLILAGALVVLIGCVPDETSRSGQDRQPVSEELVFVGARERSVLYGQFYDGPPSASVRVREYGFDEMRAMSEYKGTLSEGLSNGCGVEETVYSADEVLSGPRLEAYAVDDIVGEWCESVTSSATVLVHAIRDVAGWTARRVYQLDVDAAGDQFLVARIYQKIGNVELESLRRRLAAPYFYSRLEDEPPGIVQFGIEEGTYLVKDGMIYLVSGVFLSDLRERF